MKKFVAFLTLGLAAILTLGSSALAQGNEVVADIPFDFSVGQQHFAAGTYHLRNAGDRLQIRTADGQGVALVPTSREPKLNAYENNAVRFVKEAGQYEFAGVQTAGTDYELQLLNKARHTHVEAYEIVKGK